MHLDFEPAEEFRGTRLLRQRDNLAYAYETAHKAVDADGAPNAYHPDDTGLDALANAGYPNTNWWKEVLVPDPDDGSRAFIQPGGPYKGFFVAMTSLRQDGGNAYDPATYVDATRFPYIVIPSGFEHIPHVAKAGDVGFATNLTNGLTTPFIVGDAGGGGDAKLGEASIALYTALGGHNPNPRNGQGVPAGVVQYIVFLNSRKPVATRWPRTLDDVSGQVQHLLQTTPGIG
jgi:hypothetical protein